MSPEQNPGPYGVWNEQAIRRTGTGVWLLTLCPAHRGLNLPGKSSDQASGGQDVLGVGTAILGGVQAGQGIRLPILGTGTVGEGEIESPKEYGPTGLSGLLADCM